MLKQRKHSPFDEFSSPDGNHFLKDEVDGEDDDEPEAVDEDEDECCSDASDNSQKALVFAD